MGLHPIKFWAVSAPGMITTAVKGEEKGVNDQKRHSLGFEENLSHKAADCAE